MGPWTLAPAGARRSAVNMSECGSGPEVRSGLSGCALAALVTVLVLVAGAAIAIQSLNESLSGVGDMVGVLTGPPGSVSPEAEEETRQFWICGTGRFQDGSWSREALRDSTTPALQELYRRLIEADTREERLTVIEEIEAWCERNPAIPTTVTTGPARATPPAR